MTHQGVAAATVPVGNYARAAFAKMAGHDGYPPDYPAAVLKNVVSNELDVKAVATAVPPPRFRTSSLRTR